MAKEITRRTLMGTGSTLMALGAVGMLASQCVPTEAPAAVVDPMLDFVGRYRAAVRVLDDDDFIDAFMEARITPLCNEVLAGAPVTTSEAGAREGLRLSLFLVDGGDTTIGCDLMTSVLAFLDGRA